MFYAASQKILGFLINALPLSPFTAFFDSFSSIPAKGLAWLNWFFPVSECLAVMAAWLVAVAAFYLYSVIMRWVKLIGD